MRLATGDAAPPFTLPAVGGGSVSLEQFAGGPLLLMFYRYASCPMCNLRLHDFAGSYRRLHERGLDVVAVFHSPSAAIGRHAGSRTYPFVLAADPEFRIYHAYGVETSWARLALSSVLPSFYVDWIRSMRHGFMGGVDTRMGTMPADFVIDADGRIAIAHYGRDIGDHLPMPAIESFLDRQGSAGGGSRVL